MRIVPLHEVRDEAKVLVLTASMRVSGWQGRPLLVLDLGNELQALTGSHRLEAARRAGVEPVILMVDTSGHIETGAGCAVCGEACWVPTAIEARDDDSRLDAVRLCRDPEAVALMEAELVGQGLGR